MQVKTGERLVCSSSSSNTSHKCAAIEWGSSASVLLCVRVPRARLGSCGVRPLRSRSVAHCRQHDTDTLHCTRASPATDTSVSTASRPAEHSLRAHAQSYDILFYTCLYCTHTRRYARSNKKHAKQSGRECCCCNTPLQ